MPFLLLFFLIIGFLCVLLYLGAHSKDKDISRLIIAFSLFICAIIIGTRYNIGGDFQNYEEFFRSVNSSDFGLGERFSFEYGYYAMVSIPRDLQLGSQSFFVVSSLVTMFFFSLLFKKREWLLPMGILVFLLCTPFRFVINGVRQGVAIFAFLNGITYIYQNKPLRERFLGFAFWVFIASLFHTTAILYLLTFPLLENRIVKGVDRRILMIIAVGGFVLNIIGITDRIFYAEGLKAYNPLLRYLDDERFVMEQGAFGIGSYLTLFFYVFILSYYDKVSSSYPESKAFFILLALGLFIKYMLPGNMFANRIAYYFIFGEVLVIPYFITYLIRQKDKHRTILVPLFILWYIVLFLFDYPEFVINQVKYGATFCGFPV